jgi:hypothetical protein
MQYVMLIYADPKAPDTPGLMSRYEAFTKDMVDRGALRGGNQLQRAPAATTVSVRDGKTIATDGPYAETKEHLGGFYILECKDLEEAVCYASKIPNAQDGYIEVRPTVG